MAVAVPPFPIARFSVEQYHRLIQSGAFTEDDCLELIDGWVRDMAIPSLASYGVVESDFSRVAPLTDNKNNPAHLSEEELLEVLALAG